MRKTILRTPVWVSFSSSSRAKSSGPIGVGTALAWCVLPYLPADVVKILLAAFLTGRLSPLINKEDKP